MHLPDDQPKFDLHPDRLRSLAILFNLPEPPKVEQAQIVFLGVSHGANVLAVASEYPNAKITAVVSKATYARRLQNVVKYLHLKNVCILLTDKWLEEPVKTSVDYILCHSYFSYLSDADKQKHIEHIAQIINPKGLIYINYLTEPGWQAFESVQYLLTQTYPVKSLQNLDIDMFNQSINLIYPYLSPNQPLYHTINYVVPHMTLRTHPSLNGYWSLKPAHADTTNAFLQRLHAAQLGYLCDSDITRYYFNNLPENIQNFCGLDFHLLENMHDLLNFQASRASIILPIAQLVDFYLPSREKMIERLPLLHISGYFQLNKERTAWSSNINPSLTVSATVLNSLLIESINHVYQAHSTLSVAKLLSLVANKFQTAPDIQASATALILDLILSGALHIRSQRQNGFKHQSNMLALHHWRLQHDPDLQPSNKWLHVLTPEEIEMMLASKTENAAENIETNVS